MIKIGMMMFFSPGIQEAFAARGTGGGGQLKVGGSKTTFQDDKFDADADADADCHCGLI